jgi:uncharacterized protein YuzE
MKVKYDPVADAAYISLADVIRPGAVTQTYPCDPAEVNGIINLDFDAKSRLIGIEIVGAKKRLPPEVLHSAE